jgi:iron-sulfur cluster repair protein YtfE (RIC family)
MANDFHFDASFSAQEVSRRFNRQFTVSLDLKELLTKLHQQPDLYSQESFDGFALNEIYTYLRASHVYYLESWLPKINQTAFQLKSNYGNDFLAIQILTLFIERYQIELEQHIAHEEQVLFNFVGELLNGKYSSEKKDFVINHFLFTHNDNVIVHLSELKEDLMKFESGLKDNLVFQVLFTQLEIFQNDLLIHGLIEDEVFIPKVLDYIHANFEKINRL